GIWTSRPYWNTFEALRVIFLTVGKFPVDHEGVFCGSVPGKVLDHPAPAVPAHRFSKVMVLQDPDGKLSNIKGIVRVDVVAADSLPCGNHLLAETRGPPRPDNDRFSHRHGLCTDNTEWFVFRWQDNDIGRSII